MVSNKTLMREAHVVADATGQPVTTELVIHGEVVPFTAFPDRRDNRPPYSPRHSSLRGRRKVM